jgi:hypothetical protein
MDIFETETLGRDGEREQETRESRLITEKQRWGRAERERGTI